MCGAALALRKSMASHRTPRVAGEPGPIATTLVGPMEHPTLAPAPPASNPNTAAIMRATKGADTAPEMALRRALHRRGLRFFKSRRPEPTLRSVADLVFPRARVCVFVDGCFWHGCPIHFRTPKRNGAWWTAKIDGNRARDDRHTLALTDHGWHVIRLWEHELKGDALVRAVATVTETVTSPQSRPRKPPVDVAPTSVAHSTGALACATSAPRLEVRTVTPAPSNGTSGSPTRAR